MHPNKTANNNVYVYVYSLHIIMSGYLFYCLIRITMDNEEKYDKIKICILTLQRRFSRTEAKQKEITPESFHVRLCQSAVPSPPIWLIDVNEKRNEKTKMKTKNTPSH